MIAVEIMESLPVGRRRFLTALALGGAALIGLRVRGATQASETGGTSLHKWVMVIDQSKCTGCGYCTLACQAHNDVPPEIQWNRVIIAGKVAGKELFLPRPCMHCGHAPCVSVCPVKASYKRADGIVMMNYDRCIGCRYCEVACPYGARAFNWEEFTGENPAVPDWGKPEVPRRPRGVVEKCSFCYHRIDRGLAMGLIPGSDPYASPACLVACPVRARTFGDINDPESEVNQLLASRLHIRLREDMGTDPQVYYLLA